MEKGKKKIAIPVPTKLAEELSLKEGDEVTLSVQDKDLLIETTSQPEEDQTFSLRWFLIPTIAASFLFLCYSLFEHLNQIPLVGRISIANMVLTVGLISGVFSFLVTFIRAKKDKITSLSKNISWRNFPAILVSFIVISLLGAMIFFRLVGLIFLGASFDRYTATLLFFIFSAVINYFMIYSAVSITSEKLIKILIAVILGGILFAMFTNRDYQWWQFNFSFLGTSDAKHKWSFNLTLIFSALLMVALVDCLFVDLKKVMPKNRRLFILRLLLILTALDLGAVGLFPYTETGPFKDVHNEVSGYLVYLIVILIVGIKWLLPNVTKEFMLISYLIMGILVATVVLFLGVGYLSLTAFELLSFVLSFSWVVLLLQTLLKMAKEADGTFQVKIEQ